MKKTIKDKECVHDFKTLQEKQLGGWHGHTMPLVVQCKKCGRCFGTFYGTEFREIKILGEKQ